MDTQLELLKEKWDKILESIRDDNELSNVAFKTWLLPLKVFRIEGNILNRQPHMWKINIRPFSM